MRRMALRTVLTAATAVGVLWGLAGCTQRSQPPGSPTSATTSATTSGATPSTPQTTRNGLAPSTNSTVPQTAMKPTNDNPGQTAPTTEEAMFGAGCFWGVESYFEQVPGVVETAVGYSGGKVEHPTYHQVCSDSTGHAEVIHIVFDPSKVSYEKLVRHFFHMHDPTQLNRQGPDYGRQYRSAIFTYSDAQRDTATKVRDALKASGKYKRPIFTEITPAGPFWKAEDYHQKYFDKNGGESCHIAPDGDL